MKRQLKVIIVFVLCLQVSNLHAQEQNRDSVFNSPSTSEQFYDSLRHKAYRSRITRLVYDNLVSGEGNANQLQIEKELLRMSELEGKTIASVKVRQLDIIGPSFADTARASHSWLGQMANKLHTQTNERIIWKNILRNYSC